MFWLGLFSLPTTAVFDAFQLDDTRKLYIKELDSFLAHESIVI